MDLSTFQIEAISYLTERKEKKDFLKKSKTSTNLRRVGRAAPIFAFGSRKSPEEAFANSPYPSPNSACFSLVLSSKGVFFPFLPSGCRRISFTQETSYERSHIFRNCSKKTASPRNENLQGWMTSFADPKIWKKPFFPLRL